MYFRKRFNINKFFSINASKSGLGVSFGPRGCKMSVGPKGTYLTTSIPGTGLYSRQKIGSGINASVLKYGVYGVFLVTACIFVPPIAVPYLFWRLNRINGINGKTLVWMIACIVFPFLIIAYFIWGYKPQESCVINEEVEKSEKITF